MKIKKHIVSLAILLISNTALADAGLDLNINREPEIIAQEQMDMLPADSVCVDSSLTEIPQMYEQITSNFYWAGKNNFNLHNLSFDVFEYKKNEIIISLVYDKQAHYMGYAFCASRKLISNELSQEILGFINDQKQ